MNGFLEFKEIEKKTKTSVFEVSSKTSGNIRGTTLGTIRWMPHWRRYTFYPYGLTTLDSSCLKEIGKFIDTLMVERRKEGSKTGEEVLTDGRNYV